MARTRKTGPGRRNALYAQSGGVTAVINASALGVIEACRKHRDRIGHLYAGRDGIVGALNSFIQNIRQEGFEKTLEGVSGIEVAGVVDGQNVQDIALGAAENMMTANPDLTAIYATGEPALLGAVAAVESQGRQDSVGVFGWDLTESAVAGIDAGYVKAVFQQDPAGMGKAAVEALTAISSGGTVEPVISVPITIVTKENVDGFRAMFK